jgi:hypothetical protein
VNAIYVKRRRKGIVNEDVFVRHEMYHRSSLPSHAAISGLGPRCHFTIYGFMAKHYEQISAKVTKMLRALGHRKCIGIWQSLTRCKKGTRLSKPNRFVDGCPPRMTIIKRVRLFVGFICFILRGT